ncbi:MAG TPA: DUF255 domain-containing protein [Chitinophagales bacterium]|nr:DUF255 domain-containing protein [Chitinophagales bacterium]HPE98489.1 DUF255 domain-containing protein [Chitinophagales bacterium]HPR30291.1 DUF255 domain-containing protein [Chitinophagales bacterium]HQU76938.1 DUF255 domain-containing protein [Chitinophagales bacterium]HRX24608.1 DUF255 domain-containing protein [Chitinophagales bacterium]
MFTSIILSGLLFLQPVTGGEETSASEGIQWLTLEEAVALSAKEEKPLLIDFYTDWCGWCRKLDATTYQDQKVIDYVNKYFYAVKFDAESQDSYEFNGKTYGFKAGGGRGTNEFALKYASRNGRLGYPTTTFMFADGESLMVVPGYQDANQMTMLLRYLGEEHYKTQDFNAFKASVIAAESAD